MASNIHQRSTWTGTDAERTAMTPDVAGTTFYCTDTDTSYWWDGSAWIIIGGTSIKEIVFTMDGTIATATGVTRVYNTMGISFHITKVLISADTAPTGILGIKVDVHNGGVTIFTNQTHRPEITSGNNTGETTTIDLPDFDDDDYLTVDPLVYRSASLRSLVRQLLSSR